ncbi:hypothetical protein GPSY_5058 [Paraglaciecola psychrophila 170]|nr:hypothetical protein GPSY_5058 [Paraglaciecola psychrophila 170]
MHYHFMGNPFNRIVGISHLQAKSQVIDVENGFSFRWDRFGW